MNKTATLAIGLLVAVAASGCASRASGIAPVYVSSSEYSGMTCEETREALATARESENALTRRQNNAATADAAGVFLLLVPAGSVFGGDVSGELAQAKGEADALERAVRTNCED
jgi:hypothetical protein